MPGQTPPCGLRGQGRQLVGLGYRVFVPLPCAVAALCKSHLERSWSLGRCKSVLCPVGATWLAVTDARLRTTAAPLGAEELQVEADHVQVALGRRVVPAQNGRASYHCVCTCLRCCPRSSRQLSVSRTKSGGCLACRGGSPAPQLGVEAGRCLLHTRMKLDAHLRKSFDNLEVKGAW